MKAKPLLTLVGLISLLGSPRSSSQTSIVPWSASGMGYEVSSSSTTIVKSLVGQGFVGTMQGANSTIEAGFLVDTLFRTTVTSVVGPPELPKEYALLQNYPNPFNPSTTIRCSLPHRSHVILTVFNTLVQRVAELINGEVEAGYHDIQFNANTLATGVYFYRLQAGSFTETMRLVILK